MRQEHRAGEKMFVDYCGQTVPIVGPATGEILDAQVFVAVLGASNYTYAEATWSQSLADWTGSHVRTFYYFGSVPHCIVRDNLLSGVTKPCRYEPGINQTFQELATHYGTAVIPACVRKPRDKPNTGRHHVSTFRRINRNSHWSNRSWSPIACGPWQIAGFSIIPCR